MVARLTGKYVAMLVADGFEQIELTSPIAALEAAGAKTFIVLTKHDVVRGWKRSDWGDAFEVDLPIDLARADDFDALVLPGGVMNPDRLRRDTRVRAFVRNFFEKFKPVAAICHGPWTLIDAGVVAGREVTSCASLRTDLQNAGARWVDRELAVDSGLITSRTAKDLEAFNTAVIENVAEARPAGERRVPTGAYPT
jgi:protease I